MSAAAAALFVTADKALAGELARLLMGRQMALQVVGTKSSEVEPGGAELVFIDVSTEFGLALVATFAEQHPECAVLAVAPAAQARLGLQAARSGAADFVRYPFEAEELNEAVRKAEKRALEKALKSARGNRSVAARLLGVSRRTLYNKLEEHKLD